MLDVILIYRILYKKSIAATHFSHSRSTRTDVWNFYCRLLVPRTSWFLQELVIPRTNSPLLSILKHIAQQIRVNYWIYHVKTHNTSYFWILWDESYYGHTLRIHITNPIFTKSLVAEDRWEAELDLLLAFSLENSWDEPQDRRSHPASPAEPDTRLLETI